MNARTRSLIRPIACLSVAAAASVADGGAYIFAGFGYPDDLRIHPSNYDGATPEGGVLRVTVAARAGDFPPLGLDAIAGAVETWNAGDVTVANVLNGSTVGMPFSAIDFESVLLHEMGHALGLAHPTLASESGLPPGADRDYAKGRVGGNGMYDLALGPDGVRGTADDVRGDDVNLGWANAQNNPFEKTSVADVFTYERTNTFPNIATRDVATTFPGVPDNTEAVMVQGTTNNEVQRTLGADDVAMLELAAAGTDGVAGVGGDDYIVELVWLGAMAGDAASEDVDIWVQFSTATGFASTSINANFYTLSREVVGRGRYECGRGVVESESFGRGAPDYGVITDADILFNPGFNWHFGEPQVPCDGDATGDDAVTFDDLNLVLDAWGSSGPDGDVDDDGDVDFDDLNLVLDNWGEVCD